MGLPGTEAGQLLGHQGQHLGANRNGDGHGASMGFNGISMGFQWDFNGVSMGFQWDFNGILIDLLVVFKLNGIDTSLNGI